MYRHGQLPDSWRRYYKNQHCVELSNAHCLLSQTTCLLSRNHYFCNPFMRNAINNKRFLLVAGLLVGLVTLFSHSIRLEIRSEKSQEGKAKETTEQTIIITPSDAVTVNAFSFEVDALFEIAQAFQSVREISAAAPVLQQSVTTYFQTLFRFIISPNAP